MLRVESISLERSLILLKKISIIIALTLIVAVVASFILIQVLIYKSGRATSIDGLADKDIDYVIILGAALWDDKPSPTLYNRLLVAHDFVKENDIKIIATGGLGEGDTITEAEGIKRFLEYEGIKGERIYKDEASTSTFENLKNAKVIIRSIDDREDIKILVVTSNFHIFRSKLIARRFGFTAFGLPAETPASTRSRMVLREYFAVLNTVLFDW